MKASLGFRTSRAPLSARLRPPDEDIGSAEAGRPSFEADLVSCTQPKMLPFCEFDRERDPLSLRCGNLIAEDTCHLEREGKECEEVDIEEDNSDSVDCDAAVETEEAIRLGDGARMSKWRYGGASLSRGENVKDDPADVDADAEVSEGGPDEEDGGPKMSMRGAVLGMLWSDSVESERCSRISMFVVEPPRLVLRNRRAMAKGLRDDMPECASSSSSEESANSLLRTSSSPGLAEAGTAAGTADGGEAEAPAAAAATVAALRRCGRVRGGVLVLSLLFGEMQESKEVLSASEGRMARHTAWRELDVDIADSGLNGWATYLAASCGKSGKSRSMSKLQFLKWLPSSCC